MCVLLLLLLLLCVCVVSMKTLHSVLMFKKKKKPIVMSPDFAHPEICGVRSKIRSRSDLSREHERILHDDHLQEIFPMWILSWCFEPSQPRRITSGLTSMDTRPADRGPEETDFCVGRNTLIRSCGSKGLQMVSQEMKCGYPFVGSITSKPI